MKIFNLIKSEFLKNYSIKRFVIISIVLMAASFLLVHNTNTLLDEYQNNRFHDMMQERINSLESNISQYENKTIKTLKDDYDYFLNSKETYYMKLMQEKNISMQNRLDFKDELLYNELLPLVMKNYLIEIIDDNREDSFIVDNCKPSNDTNEYNFFNDDVFGKENIYISEICKYNDNEKNEMYQSNLINIKELENILFENKFYLYLKYKVDKNKIEKDEMINLLINQKIDNSLTYNAFNYLQYQILNEIDLENKNPNINPYYYKNIENNINKFKKILLYSTEHNIKNSIHYNDAYNVTEYIRYQNTKLKVDHVFHLSVVVMLLVSIINGGIVSNEHNKGTIKNIITAPVRRWKILLSKFIYLILDTYIIWLIGLILISIISGIKYGFSDLFTPQLLYNGNKVIEVNYYIYLLKEMIVASIPIICFLSILFFFSTIFLNTALTVGVSTFFSIISPILWMTNMVVEFEYFVYTPILYFDLGFIKNNSDWYIKTLEKVSFNETTGIIISIITIVILYTITNIIYTKRDIKN